MVRGVFPRANQYPAIPTPFEKNRAVSSDSDSEFDTIQDAIDVTASGGQVTVGPGTFEENLTVDKSGLTIVGSGRPTFVDGGLADHAVEITADDVIIQNLSAATDAGGGNLHQPFISNGGADGTLFLCWVRDSDAEAVQIQDASWNLSRVIVEATDNAGIVSGAGTDINNCLVKTGVGEEAYIVNGDDTMLNACRALSPPDGIFIAGDLVDIGVNGCIVLDSGGFGISCQLGPTCTINGSVFKGSTGNDVLIDEDSEVRFGAGNIYDTISLQSGSPKRAIIGGLAEEEANAEEPTASRWQIGDIVDFTDTGDGTGTGLYMLMQDETTWRHID